MPGCSGRLVMRLVRVGYCVRKVDEYLATLVRTHCNIAECPTCKAGVHACAERGLTFFTVEAAAISYVEGEHNSVAFLEEGDATADFLNNAHILVACMSVVVSQWHRR